MIRGFVTGLVWGGIVAGAGLAVMSLMAPLPRAGAPEAVVEPATTPEPVVNPAPEPVVPPEATPEQTPEATAEPTLQPTASPAAADPTAEPAAPPVVEDITAPDSPAVPETGTEPATLPQSDGTTPEAAPVGTPAPASPDAAPPMTEPVPSPPEELLLEPVLEAPEPALPEGPKILQPGGESLPGDTSRLIVPDSQPLPDAPKAATTDLPRIGGTEGKAEPAPTPATALDLFARPFDNADGKPLFAILLVDDGAAGTDRETLAALPFPVSFAIDPLSPGAAEAAAIYRRAGQEVVILANAIPAGATPADLEQSLQALDLALPDAVAVMGGEGLSQDNRKLATALVPIVAAQGRGLVTLEKGLNALEQVARRDAVPTATVFRKLDAAGETVPVMRRYLDRAAFRAAQEGSVVVMGTTKPDTIAAILQWNVEGRAASVALAPISAVMRASLAE